MAEIENENFIVRQGAAGSLNVQLLSGDVLKAVKKATLEARLELAEDVAREARDLAPKKTGAMAKGIKAGKSKTGNAFVSAPFPAAFVELGHRIANGKTGRLKKKKRGGGLRKGEREVAPRPFLRPALDSKLRGFASKLEGKL